MTVAEDSCRLRRFGLTERLLLEVLGLRYLNIEARWATDSSLPPTNDYVLQHRGCPQSQYFGNAEIAPALPFVLAHVLVGSGRKVSHMAFLCYQLFVLLCRGPQAIRRKLSAVPWEGRKPQKSTGR